MTQQDKLYHFIYKTTNIVTGKYYYGMHSTNNINDNYLGSGKRLRYSIRKYGVMNHIMEILEFLPDRVSLIKREKSIVTLNEIAKEDCMNLMAGGTGGFISDEQQRYRSVCGGQAFARALESNSELTEKHRIIVSTNMRNNLLSGKINRCDWTGRRHKSTSIENISKSKKLQGLGKENSQYNTCWVTKNGVNKKVNIENLPQFIQDGWIRGRKIK